MIKLLLDTDFENKFFEYKGQQIVGTMKKNMTVFLSNNYVLSQGKEIIEKSNFPKVEFDKHNLNPQLSYLSYNLRNNLGEKLVELLEETKSRVNKNMKEEIVQTFMIELIILCTVNMFLGCLCFY